MATRPSRLIFGPKKKNGNSRTRKNRLHFRFPFLPCFERLEARHLLAVDLVSVTPPPASPLAGNDYSSNPAISANGRFIAFQSYASDLVATDTNVRQDVFVRDLLVGTTALISVNADGTDSSICDASVGCSASGSFAPAISDDGRYVAFLSDSTDLVKGTLIDVVPNVYVRDRDADGDGIFDESGDGETSTTLLSLGSDLTAAGVVVGSANRPVISGDGKFVIFTSFAVDMLVDDPAIVDTNGFGGDLYRASVEGGAVTRINVDGSGLGTGFASGTTFDFTTDRSGDTVAFATSNNGLVTAATGGVNDSGRIDVFVGSGNSPVDLVSINRTGTNSGNGNSREPQVSRNGRHVAFFSRATDLVAGASDNNVAEDLFVRDLKSGTTTLVSRSREVAGLVAGDRATPPSPLLDSEVSAGPAMSDDGRFIVFRSLASDLLDPALGITDGDAFSDIFVLDRDSDLDGIFDEAGETEMILVSINAAGTGVGVHTDVGISVAGSTAPSISSEGRYVTFSSTARDLIPAGTAFPGGHVYVRDLWTGVTSMVSKTSSESGIGPNGISGTRFLAASRDGSRVAFQSDRDASDLDPSVTDPPSGSPVPFGEVDLFAGTPDADIVLSRNFAMGSDLHTQSYRILFEDASPFDLGYYRSPDAELSPSDTLLGTVPVSDYDDLRVGGNRFLTATIGSDVGEIAFPGVEGDDPLEDYFILTVGDNTDVVSEFDADPFNEDNTRALRGLYHLPGGPVFIHGSDSASADTITATVNEDTLVVDYGSTSFGLPATFRYDVVDVTTVNIRTHDGDDIVVGSELAEIVFGGFGADDLRGELGDDRLFGGPGNDRIDGGEGGDRVDGGEGADVIFGGPGADMLFDGPGDDRVDAGTGDDTLFATPGGADVFIDTGGDDTLNFSLALLPITIDLDSTAVQTVDSAGNTIRLIGQWENLVGSPLDDDSTIYVKPLSVPRSLDGGGGTDRLIVDAGGAVVVDDGTTLSFPGTGLGDVSYVNFAEVRVVRAAAEIIDDGDSGYAAEGFTRQFNPGFLQGFDGDIEFSAANAGNVASWTFHDLTPGPFVVSATWTHAPDRSENARYVVRDGDSTGPIIADLRVNQELATRELDVDGILFNHLAVAPISGHTLTVELYDSGAELGDDDPDSFVIADAVRIEPVSSTLVIDDGDSEFSSSGNRSVEFGAFGDLTHTPASGNTSGGVWDCTLPECRTVIPDGRYLVSAAWEGSQPGAATNASFTVHSGANSFSKNVNQFIAPNDFSEFGIDWQRLGVIEVVGGAGIRTELTGTTGVLLADAIRIDPAATLAVYDQSGASVNHGDTVDLGQTALDFQTGRATLLNRIKIQNTGIADLVLSNLRVNDGVFSIIDPGVDVLPAGSWTEVALGFDADSLGTFNGQLAFETNDYGSGSSTFTVNLTAAVMVDETPPMVRIVSPDNGTTLIEGTTIRIPVEVSDDVQVRAVDLLVNGIVVETVSEAPFVFDRVLPRNVTSVEIGAIAHDIADNRSSAAPITLQLVGDQAPTVRILSPADGQGVVEGTRVRVAVEAEDDRAVRSVELLVDGQSEATLRFDPFVFEFELPNSAGDHEVEVRATDSAGQIRSHAIELTSFALPIIDFGSIVVGAEAGNPAVVRVFDAGGETFRFQPYGPSFTGGVRVASGDVNGDGTSDIITGAGPGGFSHVKVFDGATGNPLHGFQAFDQNIGGGVFVAAGDVSGDGFDDIIVSAGQGAAPQVKVFDGITGAVLASFFAFDPQFFGGVRVAAGDLNGDGQAEIITATGAGGGPHVRVFDGHTASQIPRSGSLPPEWIQSDFFAFGPSFNGGVFVTAADFNGDGLDDIVVGADQGGSIGGGHVKAIDSALLAGIGRAAVVPDPVLLANFFAYDPGFLGGVHVAAGDVTADGISDIVITPGVGVPAEVKVFDGTNFTERGGFELGPGFLGSAVVVSNQPIAAVVNLQPTGLRHIVELDAGGVVVRDESGNIIYRPGTLAPKTIRLNGTPDLDDLLIFRTLGTNGLPRFVFDGGVGGNDALRLERGNPDGPPLEFLKTNFQSILNTTFSTNRNGGVNDYDLNAIDLEPIEDTLEVVDREFVFADSDDNIVYNTGSDDDDTVLRIDSNHSEVVDFQQASGITRVNLGDGADVFRFDLPVDLLPILDGQGGNDTFVLGGSGRHLDLTNPNQSRLSNFERIDIVGNSPNELTLDAQSVIDTTDLNNVLTVVHDEDDKVNYVGDGWVVRKPIFDGVGQRHVLTNGLARVETINTRPWQNPFAPTDVNRSGATTALDALHIINLLNRYQSSVVMLATPSSQAELANFYYDVNGSVDNFGIAKVTVLDALDVINFIERHPRGLTVDELLEPESPPTETLALAILPTPRVEVGAERPREQGVGDVTRESSARIAIPNSATNPEQNAVVVIDGETTRHSDATLEARDQALTELFLQADL